VPQGSVRGGGSSKHCDKPSSFGIATGHGLDGGVGVRVPVGSKTLSRRPDRFWGATSLSNGYRGLSPGVKRQGSEADYSPPTSVEVRNTWIYTSTPPYVFMA
jgi:hypothetical protein